MSGGFLSDVEGVLSELKKRERHKSCKSMKARESMKKSGIHIPSRLEDDALFYGLFEKHIFLLEDAIHEIQTIENTDRQDIAMRVVVPDAAISTAAEYVNDIFDRRIVPWKLRYVSGDGACCMPGINRIVIGRDIPRQGLPFVFAHEFTHQHQSVASYGSLAPIVKNRVVSEGLANCVEHLYALHAGRFEERSYCRLSKNLIKVKNWLAMPDGVATPEPALNEYDIGTAIMWLCAKEDRRFLREIMRYDAHH